MRVAALLVVVAGAAHAEPEEAQLGEPVAGATNRFNLRLGGATSDSTGRPVICADVRIWSGLGVESCGTGQGLIHDEPGSELAHFRATWSVLELPTSTGTGRIRGGLGWAELQVGVDHPGFHFNDPDPNERGSVAGPEASAQAQWLVPLGKGIEAIASFTAGVAAFAHANELVVPKSNVQPFASFEVGLGW